MSVNWKQLEYSSVYGRYFPLLLVSPFMVFLSMVYCIQVHLVHILRHYSFCIATVNLLKSLRLI